MICAAYFTVTDSAAETATKEIYDAGEATYREDPSGGGGIISFENRNTEIKSSYGSGSLKRSFGITLSKYDPRTDFPYNGSVAVKNQYNTGLCWAFTATTAAERNSLTAGREYRQLSPAHFGYFLYNRANDPLGNTAYDKNVIAVSGRNYTDIGGNNLMSFQAMANWTGLASESIAPFNAGNPALSFDSGIAYDNEVTLREAQVLDNAESIKETVYANGAVIADFYSDDDKYYNEENSAYYCPSEYDNNHAVTIVGWDDDYSRENFNAEIMPSSDGAWIVQNSWGRGYGEDGYFYISYEDATLPNPVSVEIQEADTYDYNYQYDGNAGLSSVRFDAGERIANVYEVSADKGDQLLKAVGFTTWNDDYTGYTVEIYSNVTGTTNPVAGIKECSFAVSTNNAGFYTFDLPEAVYVAPGMKYSIVITAKSDTDLGVEASSNHGWVSFESGLDEAQSYWSPSGSTSWYDLYDSDCCARIKGFTTVTSEKNAADSIAFSGYSSGSTIKLTYGSAKDLKVKFTPSYSTVRELTWSSSNTAVAAVSGSGRITTKGVGSAVITAKTSNGKAVSVTVQVSAPNLAAPKSVTMNLYGYDDMKFSWSKVSGATGYYVYYKRSTWSSWKSLGTTAGTSLKKANLADGAKYCFRVYPYVKINGKTYKSSNYKTGGYVYTLKKISKPSVSKSSKNYVKVKWSNIPGESGYQIARSKYKSKGYSVVKTVSSKYSSCKVKTTRNKTYYYKVRAYKTVSGKKIYGPWSTYKSYKLK